MACPRHRLTGAQAAAHAPDGPALIWDGTTDADTLSSNGLPGWYDEHGEVHHVAADTWRHAVTGRRGTPGQPTAANGYLPLTTRTRPGGGRLIELLRLGRRAGRHWFVLDTVPAAAHRYQLRDHRDEIAPPDAVWRPSVVTAEAVASLEHPALIADGYTVLGGVLARFDHRPARQIADDLAMLSLAAMPGEYPAVQWRGDVAVVLFEHDTGEPTQLVEADRVRPDAEHRYGLGAHRWPWQAVPGAGS